MCLTSIIRTQMYKFVLLSIFIGLFSFSTEVLAQNQGSFDVAVSPSSATVLQGSSTSFTVSVTPKGTFTGTVSYSASAGGGLTVSFSPGSSGVPGTSTMTVFASTTTNPGNYTVSGSVLGGGTSQGFTVSVVVTAPNFTINVSPATVSVLPGTNASFTVALNSTSSDRKSATLAASGKLDINFGSASIPIPGTTTMTAIVPMGTTPGLYNIVVTASAQGLVSQSASVTVDVRPPPDFMLTIVPGNISIPAGEQSEIAVSVVGINKFDDPVSLTVDSKLKASLGATTIVGTGTTTLSISTDRTTAPGSYSVTIIGNSSSRSGAIERRISASILVTPPPDFSFVINPINLETFPGKTTSFSISINAVNRFNDIVVLTTTTSNSNITLASSVTGISPGSTANVTVNVNSNTTPGTYDINVVGVASGLQKNAVVRLLVKPNGDFDLSVSPTSQAITAGEKASFAVDVMAKNGFSEQISLTASSPQNAIQTSFSSSTINAQGAVMVNLATALDTDPKDYLITVTATGGGITKTATFTLTVRPAFVGDFTLTVKPDTQNVSAGKATSFDLDIQGQNGFVSIVSLKAEVAEPSLQIGFAPSNPKPGDKVSITVTSSSNTPVGTYQVKIIGTSGSLVKTATFSVNVTSAPQEAFSLAIAPNKQDLIIGDATMFTVGVVGRNGFNQSVDLSAVSPDPNIQISFAKNAVAAGENTMLTINTSASAIPGSYLIMIIGKAGNTVVNQPVNVLVRNATLQVVINFDPPARGEIAPPQNVRVVASELKPSGTQPVINKKSKVFAADSDVAGYKVYRLPAPAEGQPQLTEKDLVKDENLVTTLGPNETAYVDRVTLEKGSTGNVVYSVSTFFGNGQNSGGSQPMSTDLPIVKNPMFTKGTVFIDVAGSFIKQGATITVNDMDEYTLVFDDTGTRFTVAKKAKGSVTGKTLKKLIVKGATVKLTVKNPDGKLSVGKSLTRDK